MRKFVVTAGRSFHALQGIEFETDDNATDEEIGQAAAEAVAGLIDYSWEEVAEPKTHRSRKK